MTFTNVILAVNTRFHVLATWPFFLGTGNVTMSPIHAESKKRKFQNTATRLNSQEKLLFERVVCSRSLHSAYTILRSGHISH